MRIRVQLPDRLAQAGGRDLDRDPGCGDRLYYLLVQLLLERAVGAGAEDLDDVGMRQRIEEARPRRRGQLVEVPPPGRVDADRVDQPRAPVDREVADEVDGAEEKVPRIRREQGARLLLAAPLVVDLQPELHGQAAPLRLDDRPDVGLQVEDAPLRLVRDMPQRTRL